MLCVHTRKEKSSLTLKQINLQGNGEGAVNEHKIPLGDTHFYEYLVIYTCISQILLIRLGFYFHTGVV